MEPEIVERAGMTVIGLKYRGRNEHQEIPQLWARFVPRMHEVHSVSTASFGVMDNYDPTTGEYDYLAAF